jgi:hypothetical protein
MTFRLFSDLHLEFGSFDIPYVPGDEDRVLVLAGDIAVGKRKLTYRTFLEDAVHQFRKVIYIPGNHEYYGGSFPRTWNVTMKEEMAKQLNDPDFGLYLHMVDGETVIDRGVAYVCATMWTDFDRGNPATMQMAASGMNDYRVIRTGPEDNPYQSRLSPHVIYAEHQRQRAWLLREVRKHKEAGLKVVVVTHHATSWNSIAESFAGSPLNGAYASEFAYDFLALDDEGLAPDVCVHGHVHHSFKYKIGSTWWITNPRGYVTFDTPNGDNGGAFDPKLVVEL